MNKEKIIKLIRAIKYLLVNADNYIECRDKILDEIEKEVKKK